MSLFCNAPECNARHVFPRIHIQEILSHLRVIVQHYKCSNFIFEVKVSLTITRFIAGLLTLQKYWIDLIYELCFSLSILYYIHTQIYITIIRYVNTQFNSARVVLIFTSIGNIIFNCTLFLKIKTYEFQEKLLTCHSYSRYFVQFSNCQMKQFEVTRSIWIWQRQM